MKDATCDLCLYWAQREFKGDPEKVRTGFCHRFPPASTNLFSKTSADDWCGEFTPDPEKNGK